MTLVDSLLMVAGKLWWVPLPFVVMKLVLLYSKKFAVYRNMK